MRANVGARLLARRAAAAAAAAPAALDMPGLTTLAFEMMDADDNGEVTIGELENLMKRISLDKKVDMRTQKILQTLDTDKSKTVRSPASLLA